MGRGEWLQPTESEIAAFVASESQKMLNAYAEQPDLVLEHANIERSTAQGGYGRRQIYELVQNGADAILQGGGSRIHVVLTEEALYCANEGEPIDAEGVRAILLSHISNKRGMEIGRFGLGFKSVLEVSDRPEFYSRSGSFGFNAQETARRIREVAPGAERWPILRFAFALDPEKARTHDPILDALMDWSTTVVKLPRTTESVWLSEDFEVFPSEFLLFSRHASQLILDDRVQGRVREIGLENEDGLLVLTDGPRRTTWQVFGTIHKPSEEARKDGGEIADREQLPLHWAVPGEGRRASGVFWAFFPTTTETTVAGILNAPWKTNEDRQNLLPGAFNEELLEVFSELIVDNIADVIPTGDPGSILDILPSRVEDKKNWADEFLNPRVYNGAAEVRVLPNTRGTPSLPADLRLHPDSIPRPVLETWADCKQSPTDWCHSSVETKDRRYRVERLLAIVGKFPTDESEWIEALLEGGASAESSIAALKVADAAIQENPSLMEELRNAEFVLSSNGHLVSPDPATLFLRGADDSQSARVLFVHKDVARDEMALRALRMFSIRPVDAVAELEAFLDRINPWGNEPNWGEFWAITRKVDPASAMKSVVTKKKQTRVQARTVAGDFRPLGEVLMPGSIVPEDGSRDATVAVDTVFHERDLQLLFHLGVTPTPVPGGGSDAEPWFAEYRRNAIQAFEKALKPGQRPQHDFLRFDNREFVGPLGAFRHLSDYGRLKFTESLLTSLGPGDEEPWTLAHATRGDVYPSLDYQAPHIWMLRRHGVFETSRGMRRISKVVGPTLSEWARVFPVTNCSVEISEALDLPQRLEDLGEDAWATACEAVQEYEDETFVGRFYAEVARHGVEPDGIWCLVGSSWEVIRNSEVAVVSSDVEFAALVAQESPALLIEDKEAAAYVIETWDLVEPESLVKSELHHVPSGPETPLIDIYPALRLLLPDEARDLVLVMCSALRVETLSPAGKTGHDVDFKIQDGTAYVSDKEFSELDLLLEINSVYHLGLAVDELQDLAASKVSEERRKIVQRVRRGGSEGGRLLAAIGIERIKRRVPSELVETIEELNGPLGEVELAELAFSIYGVDLLREFRGELDEVGLQPPSSWSGSRAAREFVRELGFGREFAGFQSARRDALIEIEGPPAFPPMHEFQFEIKQEFQKLLQGDGGLRAILSLPTGAGKTRVAVETIVEAMRDRDFPSPILWVAQTDELCEQAVQTWNYVWRSIGPRSRLSISRLWAANEAEPAEGHHVVVATIAKLDYCFTESAYEWLSEATCIVIDEAHAATTPSYTRLLEWQGMDRGKERVPLVGLTATPFRGVSEEETKRLVNRFGARRLDLAALGDDPYRALQEQEVLAQVEHEVLAGVDVHLTDEELRMLEKTRRVPASVDKRLGVNAKRNRSLRDSILEHLNRSDDWTVLLFATSVGHALTMAALLTIEGVPAAAISAETDPAARRHYVEAFRSGDVRVLTNYGVLTQGFDAPAVRSIYVARPTYSPNLYQQMIGRGLRGKKNGGKDKCLIVTVADNLSRYGEQLAFRHFEHLWNGNGSSGERGG